MTPPKFLETKVSLYHSPKLEIRRSELHRWGVFAVEDIQSREVLEEAPYFTVTAEEVEDSPSCEAYIYWSEDGYGMIGMGYSGLYNHSFEPNADYHIDKVSEIITHYAIKDISAGEEIVIHYGVENAACFDCYPEEDQTEIE